MKQILIIISTNIAYKPYQIKLFNRFVSCASNNKITTYYKIAPFYINSFVDFVCLNIYFYTSILNK